jgi:Flp pilus assembly protein CpaB
MNKKDALPIIIASVIALAITILVKWLLPSSVAPTQQQTHKEISMPEIPLMVNKEEKKTKKKEDDFVLFVSRGFKKDEKIILDKLKWEKWPTKAMQPYFIAKDHAGTPLNNGADYSNALKMWANTDIPNGVPLTMSMLTNEDPQKKKENERNKKKEEEAKKKLELEKEKNKEFIKKGMRAVTFPIDQRSATSTNMMKTGDLVDVLIMEQVGERTRTHKYKALKILAIDGVTKFDAGKNKNGGNNDSSGFFSNVGGIVSGLTTPKNVTLEVREDMVETMLKQSSANGLILSIRSQEEKDDEKDKGMPVQEDNSDFDPVLYNILNMNDNSPSSIQFAEYAKRQKEEEDMTVLMNNILSINSKADINNNNTSRNISGNNRKISSGNNIGQYEVVSGKIIGEEENENNTKSATIYRKLTASKVEFDKNGKPSGNGGGSSSEASSSDSDK